MVYFRDRRAAAWLSGAMTAGLAAASAYAVRGRSSQFFGPSVYCGPDGRRSIALTFDDGPCPGSMALLDYLSQQNLPATFFQCGMNVQRYPTLARQVYAAGHEIGNHSYSHPRLYPSLSGPRRWPSRDYVRWQFAHAQHIIQTEVGVSPALLRAPYGCRWFGMRELQDELHLLGVMWTVIGYDWRLPAPSIHKLVVNNASPGGIICLHDGRDIQADPDISEMLKAIRTIVPVLCDSGYRFETVSSLLARTKAK